MAATGVPSRSSLLPLRTLSPGGVAHRPTSLTQSSTAWSQQSTGNTDTGFPKSVQQSLDDLTAIISEQGLHTQANSAFPNYKIPSRNPHRLLASWELLSQVISETRVTQSQTQTPQLWTWCTRFPQDPNTGFTASRDKPGYSGRWRTSSTHRGSGSNGGSPHPRFSLRLIFACTRVDTCHPGNCMRSIRTFSSHHLGTHGSFQKDLG
jgi:hypothetical protein